MLGSSRGTPCCRMLLKQRPRWGLEAQKCWRTWVSSLVRVSTNRDRFLAAATRGKMTRQQIILCLLRALLLPWVHEGCFSVGDPGCWWDPQRPWGRDAPCPGNPLAPLRLLMGCLRVHGAARTPTQATAAKCIEKIQEEN